MRRVDPERIAAMAAKDNDEKALERSGSVLDSFLSCLPQSDEPSADRLTSQEEMRKAIQQGKVADLISSHGTAPAKPKTSVKANKSAAVPAIPHGNVAEAARFAPLSEQDRRALQRADSHTVLQQFVHILQRHKTRHIDLFRALDKDHNGNVSKAELNAALDSLNVIATEEEIDGLFDELDKDDSGGIEFRELDKALRIAGAELEEKDHAQAALDKSIKSMSMAHWSNNSPPQGGDDTMNGSSTSTLDSAAAPSSEKQSTVAEILGNCMPGEDRPPEPPPAPPPRNRSFDTPPKPPPRKSTSPEQIAQSVASQAVEQAMAEAVAEAAVAPSPVEKSAATQVADAYDTARIAIKEAEATAEATAEGLFSPGGGLFSPENRRGKAEGFFSPPAKPEPPARTSFFTPAPNRSRFSRPGGGGGCGRRGREDGFVGRGVARCDGGGGGG